MLRGKQIVNKKYEIHSQNQIEDYIQEESVVQQLGYLVSSKEKHSRFWQNKQLNIFLVLKQKVSLKKFSKKRKWVFHSVIHLLICGTDENQTVLKEKTELPQTILALTSDFFSWKERCFFHGLGLLNIQIIYSILMSCIIVQGHEITEFSVYSYPKPEPFSSNPFILTASLKCGL